MRESDAEPELVLPEAETAAAAEPVAEPEPLVAELAAEHGIDETTVAQIVDRVVERLKPDLVAEIARALKRQ